MNARPGIFANWTEAGSAILHCVAGCFLIFVAAYFAWQGLIACAALVSGAFK